MIFIVAIPPKWEIKSGIVVMDVYSFSGIGCRGFGEGVIMGYVAAGCSLHCSLINKGNGKLWYQKDRG